MKFHTYIQGFRQKQFKDLRKFCKIIGIEKAMEKNRERN